MLDGALGWLTAMVRDTLNAVWALLAATVFHLPDVTRLPQVVALSGRALIVVNLLGQVLGAVTGSLLAHPKANVMANCQEWSARWPGH